VESAFSKLQLVVGFKLTHHQNVSKQKKCHTEGKLLFLAGEGQKFEVTTLTSCLQSLHKLRNSFDINWSMKHTFYRTRFQVPLLCSILQLLAFFLQH